MKTAHTRKKNTRMRGSVTHGYGSMKKHRGAGSRGGRGNAGSGKRGDAKKPTFRAILGRELGRFGFSNATSRIKINPVNIYYLENSFDQLKAKGYIKDNKGIFKIDLSKLGFNKLLATGKPSRSYEITVDFASVSAIEKIKSAGGKVNVKYSSVDSSDAKNTSENNVEE